MLNALLLTFTLLGVSPAFGADLDRGLAAYESGDYATALREWRPLADQGVALAQYNLGFMYDNGRGVPQDAPTAYMWVNIAAASGNKDATENRDKITRRMTPSQVEKGQDLTRACIAKNYKGC